MPTSSCHVIFLEIGCFPPLVTPCMFKESLKRIHPVSYILSWAVASLLSFCWSWIFCAHDCCISFLQFFFFYFVTHPSYLFSIIQFSKQNLISYFLQSSPNFTLVKINYLFYVVTHTYGCTGLTVTVESVLSLHVLGTNLIFWLVQQMLLPTEPLLWPCLSLISKLLSW